jgi:hypothetical protein
VNPSAASLHQEMVVDIHDAWISEILVLGGSYSDIKAYFDLAHILSI